MGAIAVLRKTLILSMMILFVTTSTIVVLPVVGDRVGPSPVEAQQAATTLSLETSLGCPVDVAVYNSTVVIADNNRLEVRDFELNLESSLGYSSPFTRLVALDSGRIVSLDMSGGLWLFALSGGDLTYQDEYIDGVHWSDLQGGRWFFTAVDSQTKTTQVFNTFYGDIKPTFAFNTTRVSVSGSLVAAYEHGNFSIWNLTNPSKPVHLLDINLHYETPYWFRLHDMMIACSRESGFLEPVFSILDLAPALTSGDNITSFTLSPAMLSHVVWTDDYLIVRSIPSGTNEYGDALMVINTTSPSEVSIAGYLNGTTAEEIKGYAVASSYGSTIAGLGPDFMTIWNMTAVPPSLVYKQWYFGYASDLVFTDGLDTTRWGGDVFFKYPKPLTSNVSVLCDVNDLMVIGDQLFHVSSYSSDYTPVVPVSERVDGDTLPIPWSHMTSSDQGFRPQAYDGYVYMVGVGLNDLYVYRWSASDGSVGSRETVTTIAKSSTENVTAFCMDGSALYMLGQTGGYVYDAETDETLTITASLGSAPIMVKTVNDSMFVLSENDLTLYKIDSSQTDSITLEEVGQINADVETFAVDESIVAVANTTHVSVYNMSDSETPTITMIGSIDVPTVPHTEYPSGIVARDVCDILVDAEHMTVYRAAGHLGVGIIRIDVHPHTEEYQSPSILTGLLIGGAVLVGFVALAIIIRWKGQ